MTPMKETKKTQIHGKIFPDHELAELILSKSGSPGGSLYILLWGCKKPAMT